VSSRRTQEEDGPPMNLNQLEVSLMPVTCLMKNTPHIHCRKNEGKCVSFYPKISGVCPEPVLANHRNVESAFGRYCSKSSRPYRRAEDEVEEHCEGTARGGRPARVT
jgi:hypothetical protein